MDGGNRTKNHLVLFHITFNTGLKPALRLHFLSSSRLNPSRLQLSSHIIASSVQGVSASLLYSSIISDILCSFTVFSKDSTTYPVMLFP